MVYKSMRGVSDIETIKLDAIVSKNSKSGTSIKSKDEKRTSVRRSKLIRMENEAQ